MMDKFEQVKFKNEAKLGFSNWLKEVTKDCKKINWLDENTKDEWLKEYPNFCIKLNISEIEGIKDKYFLVVINSDNDFIDIHRDVRTLIFLSKIDDCRSVYVNYVVDNENKAKDLIRKLINIQEPKTTTHDYTEHSIMYHVYIIKDQELVRIH